MYICTCSAFHEHCRALTMPTGAVDGGEAERHQSECHVYLEVDVDHNKGLGTSTGEGCLTLLFYLQSVELCLLLFNKQ